MSLTLNLPLRLTLRLASLLVCASGLSACVDTRTGDVQPSYSLTKAQLGELLFNDASLSKDGTQSCASCHDVSRAFIDSRSNISSFELDQPGAVSLGQDGKSLGDINTPTIAYRAFVPDFYFDVSDPDEPLFKGGFFLNGRAHTMTEQAKGPFVNPLEMQTTEAELVAKVAARYQMQMKAIYGDSVFDNDAAAYEAIADAIVAFEKTDVFSPFSSKFDRVLQGTGELSQLEAEGLELFKAEDKGNCVACHILPTPGSSKSESLFTDFTYDNLGVPANLRVRALNGVGAEHQDAGLLDNPAVSDTSLKGAFRVTTLRNIAVTGPYMHNGVFQDLATVVHFYNSRDVVGALNPETGEPWAPAEVDETKNTEELGDLGLSDGEVDAIVAFLRTLTDEPYVGLQN